MSLITTQIGKPIMLVSYTSTMCVKSWGRNSYARALVEVSSINKLMDHVVVAIPFPNGLGHSLERIEIEYEWQPPRCDVCKIFDHDDVACPRKVKQSNVKSTVDDEGFMEVTKRKGKGKVSTHEKLLMVFVLLNLRLLLITVGSRFLKLKVGLMERRLQRVIVLIRNLLFLRKVWRMVLLRQRLKV